MHFSMREEEKKANATYVLKGNRIEAHHTLYLSTIILSLSTRRPGVPDDLWEFLCCDDSLQQRRQQRDKKQNKTKKVKFLFVVVVFYFSTA